MSAVRAVLRVLAALVAVALVAGCGVSAQERAEPVSTGVPTVAPSEDGGRTAGSRLTVYLVRGVELTPAERRFRSPTLTAALEELLEGPTRAEAADGVRTALAPDVVGVEDVITDGATTVSLTRGFTGITGVNQLLAVAQVVWTLTDLNSVDRVTFTVEGAPVEVPTDAGLTTGPVDRADYGSVAPVEEEPSGTGTPPAEEDAPPPGSSSPPS